MWCRCNLPARKRAAKMKEKAFTQKWKFEGDKLIVKGKFPFALDPGKKPKEFDWHVDEGSEAERGTWKGIYDLQGDDSHVPGHAWSGPAQRIRRRAGRTDHLAGEAAAGKSAGT